MERNPKWERDEVILALDLYFRLDKGNMSSNNPEIVELSDLLNKLPIHNYRPDIAKFRNPNGVSYKLANFKSIDPDYKGKGSTSFSKLDKETFFEFQGQRKKLSEIASSIKAVLNNPGLQLEEELFSNDLDEEFSAREGKILYRTHRIRERDKKLVQLKKNKYFKEYGRLDCEVCGFDFNLRYGEFGKGFIEVHHKSPLYKLKDETETKLSDLALLCSNCHRMIHRHISELTLDELRDKIRFS